MNPVYFSARFESSSALVSQCPEATREVAFAGRSNAGKSSAINTLTRNGKLARTSRTPGRTQLINHFTLGEGRFLVDLPGYGYAQVSKARQGAWKRAMTEYLVSREPLAGLVVVMDIRHPLQPVDWQLLEIQQLSDAPLHVLLTKSDKIGRSEGLRVVRRVSDELAAEGVEATLQDFSSLKARGVADAHSVLDHWLFDRPLPTE